PAAPGDLSVRPADPLGIGEHGRDGLALVRVAPPKAMYSVRAEAEILSLVGCINMEQHAPIATSLAIELTAPRSSGSASEES
ncbi:hypothetical protein, partial [Enterobacter hormaechei]|uniref:hypothetical protein n=1 Tax=Enterobacter hormaechei TaxID=158836 RepID=UPI001954C28B